MEAIIRHSPIPYNGPIDSTYGNSPYPVRVYCTCCRQPMQPSVPMLHDVRGWGWSTLVQGPDAVGEVVGRTIDGRVVSRIGGESPRLR